MANVTPPENRRAGRGGNAPFQRGRSLRAAVRRLAATQARHRVRHRVRHRARHRAHYRAHYRD